MVLVRFMHYFWIKIFEVSGIQVSGVVDHQLTAYTHSSFMTANNQLLVPLHFWQQSSPYTLHVHCCLLQKCELYSILRGFCYSILKFPMHFSVCSVLTHIETVSRHWWQRNLLREYVFVQTLLASINKMGVTNWFTAISDAHFLCLCLQQQWPVLSRLSGPVFIVGDDNSFFFHWEAHETTCSVHVLSNVRQASHSDIIHSVTPCAGLEWNQQSKLCEFKIVRLLLHSEISQWKLSFFFLFFFYNWWYPKASLQLSCYKSWIRVQLPLWRH